MVREAQKISSPLPLVSREVPRFHGGSLWHSTWENDGLLYYVMLCTHYIGAGTGISD